MTSPKAKTALYTLLYVISIACYSSGAFASDSDKHASKKSKNFHVSQGYLLASNNLISTEQASNIAKQGKDSKVLKISKKANGNREYYRVKLLTAKGHVRVILVDARSGEIIQENK